MKRMFIIRVDMNDSEEAAFLEELESFKRIVCAHFNRGEMTVDEVALKGD